MIRRNGKMGLAVVLSLMAATLVGCTSAQKGAGIGAGSGALIGGLIGNNSGNTAEGAAIGAAIGGLGGYAVGNEMDKGDTEDRIDEANARAAAAQEAADTVVINIENSNGSVTPVVIRRQGHVYVGPKGEIYNALPTQDQLRPVYGF